MCEQAVLVFCSEGKSTPFELSAKAEIPFQETSELCFTDNSSANISRNMSRLLPIKAAAEKSQSINSESIRAVYNEKSVVLPRNPNKFFAFRLSEHIVV